MRKLLAAIMLSTTLLVVGCTQPATVDIPSIVVVDNDSKFDQAFVRQLGYVPSNEVVQASREVGHATCAALDAGATAQQVVMVLLKNSSGVGRSGVLIAAGVGVGIYCPQYIKDFS